MDELVEKKIENMGFTSVDMGNLYEEQRAKLISVDPPRPEGFKKQSEDPQYKKWKAAHERFSQLRSDYFKSAGIRPDGRNRVTVAGAADIQIRADQYNIVLLEHGIDLRKYPTYESYAHSMNPNVQQNSVGEGLKAVHYNGYINNGNPMSPEQQLARTSEIRSHVIDNSDLETEEEHPIDVHEFDVNDGKETLSIEDDFLPNTMAEDLKIRLEISDRDLALEKERYRLREATKAEGDLDKLFNQPDKYKVKRVNEQLPDFV